MSEDPKTADAMVVKKVSAALVQMLSALGVPVDPRQQEQCNGAIQTMYETAKNPDADPVEMANALMLEIDHAFPSMASRADYDGLRASIYESATGLVTLAKNLQTKATAFTKEVFLRRVAADEKEQFIKN